MPQREQAPVPSPADPRFAETGCLFFGIGAQKAGTTWLHQYLRDHPQVCVPELFKEVHYWDTVRPPHTTRYLDRAAERARRRRWHTAVIRLVGGPAKRARERAWARWLAALSAEDPGHRAYADMLFGGAGADARATGEITPEYALLGTETFREMAALSPDARFVFILRDPLERALSGLRFWIRAKGETATSASLSAHLALSLDGDPEEVFARSRYDLTLARLEAAVPRDRIGCFFYETLFDQAEIDRLTDFLGIDPRPAEFSRRVHEGTGKDAVADPALIARAREELAPVYDFAAARFGAALPAAWRE